MLCISFGSATIASPHSRRLWSQEGALDGRLSHTAVRYGCRGPWSPAFYEGRGSQPHVTFGSGADYISGLTAHLGQGGIIGYAARGGCYHLAGSNRGMALHLALPHGERIVAVWVRTGGPVETYKTDQLLVIVLFHAPPREQLTWPMVFLQVTTSLSRSYFFGPNGVLVPMYGTRWTCLVGPGHFRRDSYSTTMTRWWVPPGCSAPKPKP